MSAYDPGVAYEQPSCVKEQFISLWIWVCQRVDSELHNRTSVMIAESNLQAVRGNIEKNKSKTIIEQDILMNELRVKTKACKGGTKELRISKLRKLIPILTRCKRHRQQGVLADQQLTLLDMQINAFETGRFQKEITDTLKASAVAMKKVGILDSDADDVDNLLIDLEDKMAKQVEVGDSIASTLVNSMDDNEDSMMKELMAMMGDDEETVEHNVPTEKHGSMSPVIVLPPSPISIMPQSPISNLPQSPTSHEIEEMREHIDETIPNFG
jgi:hypothetical protein